MTSSETTSTIPFDIIVAVDKDYGIGNKTNNKFDMIWSVKMDQQWFYSTTTKTDLPGQKNIVIMGKNTWMSLPDEVKPLPKRYNIILSSSLGKDEEIKKLPDTFVVDNLPDAFKICEALKKTNGHNVFIIGGGSVYDQALYFKNARHIYMSKIDKSYSCNIKFTNIDKTIAYVTTQQNEKVRHNFEIVSKSDVFDEMDTKNKIKVKIQFFKYSKITLS